MTGKAPFSRHRLSYPSSQIFKEQRIGLSPEDAKRRTPMLARGASPGPPTLGDMSYSVTFPRPALTPARTDLLFKRRCFDPKVGFVGRRFRWTCAASSTISCSRANASARFCSWLRVVCVLQFVRE